MKCFFRDSASVLASLGLLCSFVAITRWLALALGVSLEFAITAIAPVLALVAGFYAKQIADEVRKLQKNPRIFISYSYADKDIAERLKVALTRKGGKPWLAAGHLGPGQHWNDQSISAIDDADVFVALLSSESEKHAQWVEKEIQWALDKNVSVKPVIVGSASVPDSIDGLIPVYLGDISTQTIEDVAECLVH